MEPKKLYRSNTSKVFAGVCGGMGDYFNIDPVIVRLIWVAATLISGGGGILGYIIAALVIPKIDDSGEESNNRGCLVAIFVVLLALVIVPAVFSILGFVGYTLFSGVSHIAGATSAMHGIAPLISFNYSWIPTLFSILLTPALIIVIVILLITRKNDKKDK